MLITEIAREARVSPATVSRAINQPGIVSPETLARIREVIARFNYVPLPVEHRRGPKARLGTPHRAGLWFVGANPGSAHLTWFQEQLSALQETDPRCRLDLQLLTSSTPSETPRALRAGMPEAFIVQGQEPSPSVLQKLKQRPVVWFMTRRSPDYAGDYVEPNNEENGRLAANYLHQRGHRVVAVVATDPDHSAIDRRQQAFVARARELNLTIHVVLGAPTRASFLRFSAADGECAALAAYLLRCAPRATGLYLPGAHNCTSLFAALQAAGCRPGRDLDTVLGNHHPALTRYLDHTPAMIDINLPLLARKVVEHLLWRIENPLVPGRVGISVSPHLVPPPATRP